MNSSEFHVLTVEHGWVVGNGEGVDMGDYMCEQLGLLQLVRVEEGAHIGGGGKIDMVYKRSILYWRAVEAGVGGVVAGLLQNVVLE